MPCKGKAWCLCTITCKQELEDATPRVKISKCWRLLVALADLQPLSRYSALMKHCISSVSHHYWLAKAL